MEVNKGIIKEINKAKINNSNLLISFFLGFVFKENINIKKTKIKTIM